MANFFTKLFNKMGSSFKTNDVIQNLAHNEAFINNNQGVTIVASINNNQEYNFAHNQLKHYYGMPNVRVLYRIGLDAKGLSSYATKENGVFNLIIDKPLNFRIDAYIQQASQIKNRVNILEYSTEMDKDTRITKYLNGKDFIDVLKQKSNLENRAKYFLNEEQIKSLNLPKSATPEKNKRGTPTPEEQAILNKIKKEFSTIHKEKNLYKREKLLMEGLQNILSSKESALYSKSKLLIKAFREEYLFPILKEQKNNFLKNLEGAIAKFIKDKDIKKKYEFFKSIQLESILELRKSKFFTQEQLDLLYNSRSLKLQFRKLFENGMMEFENQISQKEAVLENKLKSSFEYILKEKNLIKRDKMLTDFQNQKMLNKEEKNLVYCSEKMQRTISQLKENIKDSLRTESKKYITNETFEDLAGKYIHQCANMQDGKRQKFLGNLKSNVKTDVQNKFKKIVPKEYLETLIEAVTEKVQRRYRPTFLELLKKHTDKHQNLDYENLNEKKQNDFCKKLKEDIIKDVKINHQTKFSANVVEFSEKIFNEAMKCIKSKEFPSIEDIQEEEVSRDFSIKFASPNSNYDEIEVSYEKSLDAKHSTAHHHREDLNQYKQAKSNLTH